MKLKINHSIKRILKGYQYLLFVLVIATLLSSVSLSWSQNGKISGYYIGDYYYLASAHNEDWQGRHGFQYRRIYLNYDESIADDLAIRLRFEMNRPSFNAKELGKIAPFVKHGYLKWSNSDWRTTSYFGLIGTPTFAPVEQIWGYRSVAKTLEDLHKLGSSTDFGVATKGSFDTDKKFSYHAMLGNGAGTKGEANSDKKAYLSFTARPVEGLIAEVYGEFGTGANQTSNYMFHGLLGYQKNQLNLGLLVSNKTKQKGKDKEDETRLAGSAFGSMQLGDRLTALARIDRNFDPHTTGEKISYLPHAATAASNTIILGVDWSPAVNTHIIPNLVAILYDEPEKGDKPDMDLQPRLTLYYKF